KQYFLRAMDSVNYVTWDTLPPSSGGVTNITADKVGNTVTINSSTGTGDSFSVDDGDSDDTNEIDIMQSFLPENIARFVPSYNDLRVLGAGGINVTSTSGVSGAGG